MKVVVVGTGYVGLVTGACLAEVGTDVICVDVNETKINNLHKGILPIYEPGLDEIVGRNYKNGRLSFSTKLAEVVPGASLVFIAVGTPPGEDGSAFLRIPRLFDGKDLFGGKLEEAVYGREKFRGGQLRVSGESHGEARVGGCGSRRRR